MSQEQNTSYLDIDILCSSELTELLGAELLLEGYEGIWEHEKGLNAYILRNDYNPETLQEILARYNVQPDAVVIKNIADINWNENWEKSYEPILVGDQCFIRAEFHEPKPGVRHDIVIQPKMSFGTGHHDTTRLSVELMLNMDWEGKRVIDVGCGTGVLAILAGQMGATDITAIDNSVWSYENTVENAERNGIRMEILLSDIEGFNGNDYDMIISNITRNINHAHIPKYAEMIKPGGTLLMSGFFDHDHDFIHTQAINHGFSLLNKMVSEKNWIAISYTKQQA